MAPPSLGAPLYQHPKNRPIGALGRRNPYGISLDRINSAQGYTIDNVRLVLIWINNVFADYGDTVMRHIVARTAHTPPPCTPHHPSTMPSITTNLTMQDTLMTSKDIMLLLETLAAELVVWDRHCYQSFENTDTYTIDRPAGAGISLLSSYGNFPNDLSAHATLTGQALHDKAAQKAADFFAVLDALPGMQDASFQLFLSQRTHNGNRVLRVALWIDSVPFAMHQESSIPAKTFATRFIQMRKQLELFDWSGPQLLWQTRAMRDARGPVSHRMSSPDVCLAHIKLALIANPKPTYADLISLHGRKLYAEGTDHPSLPDPSRMPQLLAKLNIPIPDDGRYVDPYGDATGKG